MTATHDTVTEEAFRFLIVDDSRAIQAIIRRIVEACGYPAIEIETATDGEAALDIMARYHPHLILTDWHMPKMSGLELMQTVRQLGQTDVKMGLITTETSPSMLEEALRNGALFVLNKPFKDDELIAQLRQAMPPDRPPPVAPTESSTTALQKPGPGTEPARLMVTDDCQRLVVSMMNGIPLRLLEQPPLASSALTPQNLIGLYGGKSKPVTAIGVLDMNAICIFGGGEHRLAPTVVREAMQRGQASEDMVKRANLFMQSAGALLRLPTENEPLPLSRTSLVPQGFQKLNELLLKNSGRADFRISVPGYGDGRFSFLAV